MGELAELGSSVAASTGIISNEKQNNEFEKRKKEILLNQIDKMHSKLNAIRAKMASIHNTMDAQEKKKRIKKEWKILKRQIFREKRQVLQLNDEFDVRAEQNKKRIDTLNKEVDQLFNLTKQLAGEPENLQRSSISSLSRCSRYPAIDAPETVEIHETFSLLFSLTEEQTTPEVNVKQVNKKFAQTESDGKITFKLPKKVEWEIEIVLTARGFTFIGGNTGSIVLPEKGDSTPAKFQLKAKPIDSERQVAKVYATLWYKGTYLAKIERKITVVDPAFKQAAKINSLLRNKAVPFRGSKGLRKVSVPIPQFSALQAEAAELSPAAAPPVISNEPDKSNPPIELNLNLEQADLTVFILESPDTGENTETQIIINSPYIQPTADTCTMPRGLSEWLEDKYSEFITYTAHKPKNDSADDFLSQNLSLKDRKILFMKGFGKELYDKYAPPVFKEAFWKLSDKLGFTFDTIQIISNNPVLPWELMIPVHPDRVKERNFLGIEFSIGRWHIRQSSPGQLERPPQRISYGALFAVAPKYKGEKQLPGQTQELDALKKISGYRYVHGRLDDIRMLLKLNPEGVIHFIGHGIIQNNENDIPRYAIQLEDMNLDILSWKGLIHTKNRSAPLYFFNACNVGRTKRVANFVDGWAPAVLEAGAGGYIGALWPLGDQGAADFATHFYTEMDKQLKTGSASIAELLRETRKLFLKNGDPAFMAYVFYGDPNLKFWKN